MNAALDVLCVAPGRLGQMEGTTGEASSSGTGHTDEEASDGSQLYVLEWPLITRGSTLATAEAKLEWMQNCLPLNMLEGYKDMGASSVICLGVQSALLGAILAIQAERVITK